MLRKTLLASCLLIASGSALAFDDFRSRHGVHVSPGVSITISSGPQYDDYRPYRYAPRYVEPVYYRQPYRGHGRHHGWGHHRDDRHHDRHERRYRDDRGHRH